MGRRALVAFFWCALVAPVVAQETGGALQNLYQDMGQATVAPVTLEQRAQKFSALGALPADTDSFLALRGLGGLCSKFAGADAATGLPVAAMGSMLDGFAVGMSEGAVRDVQRLIPLFKAVMDAQEELSEKWLEQAEPGAALAVVAQQREAQRRIGEQLVAATKDFHMAPVYMVLSSHPDGQLLLYQLSALPYLLPLEPGGALEWVVQGQNRGICIRGDKLDLSEADLAPEHEQQVRESLRNVRLYIMMRVLQNRLVLGIASCLEELKWLDAPADSVLATERMAGFDPFMQRDAMALGYASEAMVNMREELNLQSYRSLAQFMGTVFTRLAGENTAAAAAAGAIERLVKMLELLTPPRKGAEQFMVWKDKDFYVDLEVDACGQSFEPGTLRHLSLAEAPGTALYAECTMPKGLPAVEVKTVLDDIQLVQSGFVSTVKPEFRAGTEEQKMMLGQLSPAFIQLAAGLQSLGSALGDNVAMLVQENTAATVPQQAAAVSLRASVKSAAALEAAEQQFCSAGQVVAAGMSERERRDIQREVLDYVKLERSNDAVLLHNGAGGLALQQPQSGVPVEGGFVFSLRMPELTRVLTTFHGLDGTDKARNSARTAADAAQELERIDGAARVINGRLKMRFRFCPSEKNKSQN